MNPAAPIEVESVPVPMDTSVTPKVPVVPEITDTDKPVSVAQPATRIVELVVPYDTPKQVVDLTVNLGMMAHEAVTKGMMLILFPTISKDNTH